MKISYTLTNEDLKQYVASDFDTYNKVIPKILVYVGSIILIILSLMAIISRDYLFAFQIILVLGLVFFALKLPRILKKKHIKSIDTNDERIIEINEDNLFIANSTRSTTYKFSEIKEVHINKNNNFILIKFKPGEYYFIPKSAFTNNEEMINFINAIKTKAKIL